MNIMEAEVSETSDIQEVGMEEIHSGTVDMRHKTLIGTKHQKEPDEKNHRECGHS